MSRWSGFAGLGPQTSDKNDSGDAWDSGETPRRVVSRKSDKSLASAVDICHSASIASNASMVGAASPRTPMRGRFAVSRLSPPEHSCTAGPSPSLSSRFCPSAGSPPHRDAEGGAAGAVVPPRFSPGSSVLPAQPRFVRAAAWRPRRRRRASWIIARIRPSLRLRTRCRRRSIPRSTSTDIHRVCSAPRTR
jgi:hypothetical protein